MTSRRDWQLQQLGITQWSLRRPGALQGEIAISLPEHIRLVMVAEELPALNEPLIDDVLRSLKMTADQVLQLTPERVAGIVDGVRQTYTKIINLETRLQGELTINQNAADKRFTARGTAIIPQGVIANTGDMFAADVGDGRDADPAEIQTKHPIQQHALSGRAGRRLTQPRHQLTEGER